MKVIDQNLSSAIQIRTLTNDCLVNFTLKDFNVSHTKDGFQWDENEEPFLELLKEELNADPIPLLNQAEGYRVRQKTS